MKPEDVLLEEWTASGPYVFTTGGVAFDTTGDGRSGGSERHARIAACAPEALALLAEAGSFDVKGGCGWCDWGGSHAPDCRWYALMVKAGLRPAREG